MIVCKDPPKKYTQFYQKLTKTWPYNQFINFNEYTTWEQSQAYGHMLTSTIFTVFTSVHPPVIYIRRRRCIKCIVMQRPSLCHQRYIFFSSPSMNFIRFVISHFWPQMDGSDPTTIYSNQSINTNHRLIKQNHTFVTEQE